MLRGAITTLGGAAYLSYYAFPLLASSGTAAVVMGASAIMLGKFMSSYKVKETLELGTLSEVSSEMLRAHRLIKLSDME
jgi:ATP-binding cassette subfamily B (MDR/TAP) protein 10